MELDGEAEKTAPTETPGAPKAKTEDATNEKKLSSDDCSSRREHARAPANTADLPRVI